MKRNGTVQHSGLCGILCCQHVSGRSPSAGKERRTDREASFGHFYQILKLVKLHENMKLQQKMMKFGRKVLVKKDN